MALSMDEGDWIPLWRKIRASWLWKDSDDLRAWIDLLMLANHHDGQFRFRGNIHPTKRGQVCTTYKSIAGRNGWGRGRVKRFILRLEDERAVIATWRTYDPKLATWVDSKTDSGFLLLTIVNYPVMKSATVDRTPERSPKRPGNGQGLASNWPATGHIQEGEEREERKKGEEGRASASALPTPAATPARPAPIAEALQDRQSIVSRLILDVEMMTPGQARSALAHGKLMHRATNPYPEVEEAMKKKASEDGGTTP